MDTFFSKILHFTVGMIRSYFLIGLIIAAFVLSIIILFILLMPEDYTKYFNQQFADLANSSDPIERLMPWEVTTGDRVFLIILLLIATCIIWPYVLKILFERDSEE